MPKPQVGFIAVQDRVCRATVTGSLRRLGWTIATFSSGYHLVEALAEVIIGDAVVGSGPDLIVVDAISAGCSGLTIAAGFRDLRLEIPIVLIAPSEASDVTPDAYARSVILVDPAAAASALVRIATLRAARRASGYDERDDDGGRSGHVH
jgi:CheY-like chemotaxis protein